MKNKKLYASVIFVYTASVFSALVTGYNIAKPHVVLKPAEEKLILSLRSAKSDYENIQSLNKQFSDTKARLEKGQESIISQINSSFGTGAFSSGYIQ